jgi:phosphomannomutase
MQPENRAELQRRVQEEGADVGFAFDGDGDRFFAIDDRGLFVPGDFLTALLGLYALEKCPGGKIVYDVRCSWAVRDLIEQGGGTALIERVGHSFIKPRLFEEGAVFAGELSGHYYFRDFFGADSGIVPSLLMLEMLSRRQAKFSELLAPLENRYFLSGEINSRVPDPAAKVQELAARYADGRLERLDGISVSYPDWHFNVRPSNTEPLLRLNLEALSRQKMEEKRDEVLALIRA